MRANTVEPTRSSAAGVHAVRLSALATFLSVSFYTVALDGSAIPLLTRASLLAGSLLALNSVERRAPRPLGLWSIYALGFALFADVRAMVGETIPATRAAYPIHLDRLLFHGTLPGAWLQAHLQPATGVSVLELATTAVYASYFAVPHAVAFILWRTDPARFARYVFAMLGAAFAAAGVALLVPTAPPWLAGHFTAAPHVTRTLARVLGNNVDSVASAPGGNAVAAMPSVHMALTVLVLLAFWRSRRLRAAAAVYVLAMAFSLVYLGEHYVVDELAGAGVACAAWLLVGRVRSRREVTGAPTQIS